MKRLIALALVFICMLGLIGCANQSPIRTKTIKGNLKTYYKLNDDTWECEGHIYKYRLEISGRMPNDADVSTVVYLSNVDISFDQAYEAAGVSSNMNDYFAVEDAVLVDWITED